MSIAWGPPPWGLGAINWERKKIGREEEQTGGAVSHRTKQLGFNLMAASATFLSLFFPFKCTNTYAQSMMGPCTCWALGGCTPRHGLGPALP